MSKYPVQSQVKTAGFRSTERVTLRQMHPRISRQDKPLSALGGRHTWDCQACSLSVGYEIESVHNDLLQADIALFEGCAEAAREGVHEVKAKEDVASARRIDAGTGLSGDVGHGGRQRCTGREVGANVCAPGRVQHEVVPSAVAAALTFGILAAHAGHGLLGYGIVGVQQVGLAAVGRPGAADLKLLTPCELDAAGPHADLRLTVDLLGRGQFPADGALFALAGAHALRGIKRVTVGVELARGHRDPVRAHRGNVERDLCR